MFNKIPDPKELEKELNEYLAKKYGSKIKLAMPLVIPQKDEGVIEKESKSQRKSSLYGKQAFKILVDDYGLIKPYKTSGLRPVNTLK